MKQKLFRKEKGEMRNKIYIKKTIHPLVPNFLFLHEKFKIRKRTWNSADR